MSSICNDNTHYPGRLRPENYQSFSVRPTGYVEFSTVEDKKPDFLTFEPSMAIQLVKAFCPSPCCFKFKKPDENFLDPNCWFRVLQDGDKNQTWVIAEAPDIGPIKSVYEVWESYMIPRCNKQCGIKFRGYVSLEKDPVNFYEFYQKNKHQNFEEKLEHAVLEKAHFLFFNAMISIEGKDCQCRYIFDKLLGNGQQGIVARAINIDHPDQPPIAVKMFYSRIDCSFSVPIDLIENEIAGRQLSSSSNGKVARLLHKGVQKICGMEALLMEYIDGTTLEEFFNNNPEISEEQKIEFLRCTDALLTTKDLNPSNIMVQWDATKGLMSLVQIDLALLYGCNGFKKELKDTLNSYKTHAPVK
jgi:hypothetical protein